jgi:cytidylate kinase
MIITIDGPAGSGKSTVAAALAKRLSIAYLDTGAMYRAGTLAALQKNVSLDDPKMLEKVLRNSRIELAKNDAPNRVWLNGRDVTEEIRSPEITENAHKIAAQARLRKLLVEQQRRIAEQAGSLVTEGRDQGTVAFPDARIKFYLDAKPDCRARRRWEQMKQSGSDISYQEVLANQQQRDQRDRTRQNSPLQIPENAIVIDTTDITIEQVVETLYQRVKEI